MPATTTGSTSPNPSSDARSVAESPVAAVISSAVRLAPVGPALTLKPSPPVGGSPGPAPPGGSGASGAERPSGRRPAGPGAGPGAGATGRASSPPADGPVADGRSAG